jgi:hypothetical protein
LPESEFDQLSAEPESGLSTLLSALSGLGGESGLGESTLSGLGGESGLGESTVSGLGGESGLGESALSGLGEDCAERGDEAESRLATESATRLSASWTVVGTEAVVTVVTEVTGRASSRVIASGSDEEPGPARARPLTPRAPRAPTAVTTFQFFAFFH